MKHARFFSILVSLALLAYGAVGFYFLPMAAFQGDLTRMGQLPESSFGWTKPQPPVDPGLIQQSSLPDADVLVIGDSFSDNSEWHSLVWQTVLIQHGLKVRTVSWDNIRGPCEDFLPWLRSQGFVGKYVIFESAERSLVKRLSNSVDCRRMQYHPSVRTDAPRKPPIVSFDPNRRDYSGRLSIGIRTKLNMWKYEQFSRTNNFTSLMLPNEVKLARIKNGCSLFSHALCNDALFMAEDGKEDIPASALDNIEKLNARMPGITTIWVFVPNKSTAYLYPHKQFWIEAERRFHAPNLLGMTQQAIDNKTVDLYPANNTHFLTTGYLMMGEAIFKSMQEQH